MKTNTNKAGLVGACILGGWHVIWSVLVLTGLGQILIDFVMWMHMINLPYIVGPFDITASLTLIIVTSVTGYCAGYAVAMIWNRFHR